MVRQYYLNACAYENFNSDLITVERVANVDEQLGEMFLSDTEPSRKELMVSSGY